MGRSCGLFSRRKAGKSIAGKNGTHPETFHYLSSRRADIQWTDCGWEIVNTYQWETVVVLGIPGADHLSPSSLLNCVFISIHCLPYWFPLWYVLEYPWRCKYYGIQWESSQRMYLLLLFIRLVLLKVKEEDAWFHVKQHYSLIIILLPWLFPIHRQLMGYPGMRM